MLQKRLSKYVSGGADSSNKAKVLLDHASTTEYHVLLIDEKYLQKGVQYHSRDFVREDEEGTLNKSIAVFLFDY